MLNYTFRFQMKVAYLLFFIVLPFCSWSQSDTVKVEPVPDTSNEVLLNDYSKKLAALEQQRIDDSINKAKLQSKIESLSTTDNLQKEALQAKLDELKDKEVNRLLLKKAQIDSLRKTATGVPVEVFYNDTLFKIYSRFGGFTAKDRAETVAKRITELAEQFNFTPDSFVTRQSENSVDVAYGDRVITSVSENDALWNNTTSDSLAQKYLKKIRAAIVEYRDQTSFKTLAIEVGLAILVLLVIGLLIYFIGKFFRWTALKIIAQEGKLFKGVRVKNYMLMDSQRQLGAVLSINTIVKWFVILLAIYIALPILFGIFPSTEDLAQTLFGYILNPLKSIALKVWGYVPNLMTIVVIVMIFRYVLKGVNFLKSEIEAGKLTIPGFYQDWANPTYQIVRVLIYAFMLVVIFPYLPGSDSPIFKGVSVFLGFLFTFGSAGSLSNVISGLVLTYMRLFVIGDRVKIGDITGDVIEKSLLVTRIRTNKNEIISIPNSTVMSSHTINYSSDAPSNGLIIHSTVTIGYDVPWKDMHQALIDAALRTDLVLKEPMPFVLQTSLDDFYVSYQINGYVREANRQATIYSNLHQHIQDVCNERGIEIMSPHYRAQRDGTTSTIPENYRKNQSEDGQ